MPTAIAYLTDSEANVQVLGAAYIQHECYNNSDAKKEVKGSTAILVFFV